MSNYLKNKLPLVSIIIPCRNEERFIGKCLDSILIQKYPKNKIEVLVIDGRSDDKTREVVRNYNLKNQFIKLIDNPYKVTPNGMNIGIKASKGEIVILVNSHAILDNDFLKESVKCLEKFPYADAVGGKLNAITEGNSLFSKTISFVSDSIFGSGGVRYRQREKEGFINDTLPYCAYRREVFEKIGYMDEELLRGQDAEFNLRLIKKGGKIYFSPKIKSYLHTRPQLKKFLKQQFQYGYFKVKIGKKLGFGSIFRQLIPSVFVLGLTLSFIFSFFSDIFLILFLAILSFYFLLDFIFSLEIAIKNGFKYFLPSIFVFFAFHFSYGLGFLKGIFDFLVLRKKKKEDIGITR